MKPYTLILLGIFALSGCTPKIPEHLLHDWSAIQRCAATDMNKIHDIGYYKKIFPPFSDKYFLSLNHIAYFKQKTIDATGITPQNFSSLKLTAQDKTSVSSLDILNSNYIRPCLEKFAIAKLTHMYTFSWDTYTNYVHLLGKNDDGRILWENPQNQMLFKKLTAGNIKRSVDHAISQIKNRSNIAIVDDNFTYLSHIKDEKLFDFKTSNTSFEEVKELYKEASIPYALTFFTKKPKNLEELQKVPQQIKQILEERNLTLNDIGKTTEDLNNLERTLLKMYAAEMDNTLFHLLEKHDALKNDFLTHS